MITPHWRKIRTQHTKSQQKVASLIFHESMNSCPVDAENILKQKYYYFFDSTFLRKSTQYTWQKDAPLMLSSGFLINFHCIRGKNHNIEGSGIQKLTWRRSTSIKTSAKNPPISFRFAHNYMTQYRVK